MRFEENTGWEMGFITIPIGTLTKEQISMLNLDSFGYHKHRMGKMSSRNWSKDISGRKEKVDMF